MSTVYVWRSRFNLIVSLEKKIWDFVNDSQLPVPIVIVFNKKS